MYQKQSNVHLMFHSVRAVFQVHRLDNLPYSWIKEGHRNLCSTRRGFDSSGFSPCSFSPCSLASCCLASSFWRRSSGVKLHIFWDMAIEPFPVLIGSYTAKLELGVSEIKCHKLAILLKKGHNYILNSCQYHWTYVLSQEPKIWSSGIL